MAAETATRSKRPRRRRAQDAESRARKQANGSAPEAEHDEQDEQDTGVEDEVKSRAGADDDDDDDDKGAVGTVTSEIKDVVREAALEVLKPVAKKATTEAAKFAVTKGPDLVKGPIGDKLSDAGGMGGLAEMAKSAGGDLMEKLAPGGGGLLGKLMPGGDDDDDDEDGGDDSKPEGVGKGRRLPVQESVDVGVPIDVAYNQWTQFEEFPKFMHRVQKVEQRDETHLMWHENIWGVRRQWEAEIIQQRPNERIAWKSLSGTNVTGVVTFHAISDTLTRVQVNLDFQPHGIKEKTASGFRMSRRALKSDLMRFKAFIEMRDNETGEWRGEIEDGDVVEDAERDEAEDQYEDEPEAEYEEDEPEAEADEDEPEAEYEEEEPEAEYEEEEPEAEYEEEEPEAEYEE